MEGRRRRRRAHQEMEVPLAIVASVFKQLRKVMQPTSRDEFAVFQHARRSRSFGRSLFGNPICCDLGRSPRHFFAFLCCAAETSDHFSCAMNIRPEVTTAACCPSEIRPSFFLPCERASDLPLFVKCQLRLMGWGGQLA